jgi:RND family efflux transporter MFP subunit
MDQGNTSILDKSNIFWISDIMSSHPHTTRLLPVLALLLAAPVLAAGDAPPGETGNAVSTAPAELPRAEVAYRTVPREYRLDGIVEAVNRTTVSAQTQGQVQEILYDVDDFVEKGEIIARLRDNEHRARVAQAAAELKSATAELSRARDEFARVEGLFRNKNVSESEMDRAKAELAGAEARLDAAQAALEQAQEQLRYTEIRAPYSGIVTNRHVEVGEIASPGQPVMTGISLEELRVTVDVPQSVIPAVRKIGEVNVYLPNGGAEGASADDVVQPERITVFPYADMGSNTFKVRLDLPGDLEDLFPGMFVKTGFVTGKKQELTVPKAAVVYRSEVTGVYVVDPDGGVHFRQIRVGRDHGDALVVLSGLTAGETVALDPIAAGVALKAQAKAKVGGAVDG